MKTFILSALAVFFSLTGFSQVTINEVDSNTPGSDTAEFVELYADEETSLDGYFLVFINGNGDAIYNIIDLAGGSISDGYFVVGNAATPNVDLTFDDNGLQNGQDAVGLYLDPSVALEIGALANADGLIDLVVYDSNDDDDAELLGFLAAECQVQYNEGENGEGDVESISRVPDGGTAMCPTDFLVQAPSPGASNIPSCFGGSLAFDNAMTEMSFCIDDDAIELISFDVVDNTGDGFIYILTDEENIITGTSTGEIIDSSTLPEGVCRIHGVAYNGILDVETLSAGEDAVDIASDGDCLSFASNFLTITKNVCFPDCDGGTVDSDAGDNVVVCLDEEVDLLTFTNNSIAENDSYAYVVTDEDNIIIAVLEGDSNNFNEAEAGVCRVWGLSFQGTLDPLTIEVGDPALGVQTDGICLELSSNFITVTRQECLPVEGCGTLFFSEYIEGSANNKALEIYNPTQLPISLADYQLVNCSNGCDAPEAWDFTNDILGGATLGAGDVFVIAHPDADPAIAAVKDVEFQYLSNGDDVFALQQISTGDIVDIIGEASLIDIDGGWSVNGVENGTQNHTLVRMETFNEGNNDWITAQNEWNVLEEDDFSNIGSHTIIPCVVNTDPSISFSVAGLTVNEDVGTVTAEVSVLNPLDTEMTVEVMLTGGTAVSPDDFDGTGFPLTLTFPAGMDTPQTFDMTIVDDMMDEGAETITLELMNPTDGISLITSEFTLTINPSDALIPVLEIVEATAIDSEGVATNLDLECELRGVVYGVNMRPSGVQFTLIDPTDGIGVFNFEPVSDYVVNEGDSVHVVGTIDQFNGLTQISVSSIALISSDNALINPTVITELSEFAESNLIIVECVELVDASQWTNDGSGFNVDLTDGTNTFLMRVDADTDVFGTDAPEGEFNLTGIGGQFDDSSPYNEGYQILPRYIADIVSCGIPFSIIEYQKEMLSVYPNPVANELTIDVPAKGTLRIFNSLGQVIRQINQVNQGTETLNVSNLVTGTYFIEIASKTDVYRAQVVKK